MEDVDNTSENNFINLCSTERHHPEATNPSEEKGEKEMPKKGLNVKRGRKAAAKGKPPAVDNGLVTKTYLPDDTAQTFRTHRCPKCQRCFKMRSHLREHLHLHFPDPGLQCPTCQRFFTSKSKLRVHQLREAGLKTHRCHLCEYSAVEGNSLRRHLVTVHADEMDDSVDLNYPCPVCRKSFRQSKSLKTHMKTHNIAQDSKLLSCIEDGCSFKSHPRKNLLEHITDVHGFTPVECQHHACTAIFKSQTLMEKHYRTHKAYHCSDCDFSSSNKRLFVQHQKQGHAGGDQLSCEFCDFKTFNPVEFEQHVGRLHASEKIHRCSQCSFITAHKRGLKRHMLTHSGEKPHKCSVCDFRCRDESYLSRHMLTHSDSKNYMCSECGYVTKWKHYLNVHLRKHAGDLRYQCDQCSYRCHRMDQLTSHKLRHQEKSLICEICAYSCKRKHELRNHMIAKHSGANKPATVYKCKYCTYTTSHRQALQNHENCKHTKLKEYNCALCTYTSFSSISLFLHKRKTHGYVPGDKAWLQNYALKEKEKSTVRNLDDFYNKAASNDPVAANAKQPSSLDVRETDAKVDAINDLDVVSQEEVNEDALASPEEYCTLVLTTLPSSDDQTLQDNGQNSIDVAVNCNLAPENASLSTTLSSEDDDEATLDGEQHDYEDSNQTGETPEAENSVESGCAKSQADFEVKDLKQLDKIQAEAMVLDGRVEMLMVPTQKARNKTRKMRSVRDRKRYSCQDCGAGFKERRNLDSHRKKKCRLIENSETSRTVSEASLHRDNSISLEVVASSRNVETRLSDDDCNPQEPPFEDILSSTNSYSFSESRQDSKSQPSEANNANNALLDKDNPYAKIGDKFECKQCRFSSIRLATVERHITTCTKKSSKKNIQKMAELSKERHAKNGNPTPKDFQCSECEFVAKSKLSLIRHKVRAHKKNPTHFACKLCAFSCKQERRLQQHVAIKHAKVMKPFQCRFCSFTTKRRYRLEEHQSVHTGIGRHRCDICDKTFGALSKLRQHKLRLHDKTPSHFCADCDFSGFSHDDVRRHSLRCHLGELRFNCGQCDARFSSEIALRNHRKRAHQDSFTCTRCEYACSSQVELNAHHNSKHISVKQPGCKEILVTTDQKTQHTCHLCTFAAKTKKLLAQHLLNEHEEGGTAEEKALRCSLCEFSCRYQLVLEQHLRSHGGKRLYKCTQCEYSTRNKQKMTWHVRIHTGEKPYSCELCSYTCTDPSRLKLHMRVHQEEKKYLCPECGYKCKWATQLKYHMTKHTGEKRFVCADCDYRTNRADALRSHRDTQHCSSRPFICEKCGKSFKTGFILRSHQQQHSDARPYACGLCQKAFKWPAGLRHHFLSHTKQRPFSCRLCLYRAKQRFQVVRHLQRHHPEATAEEGVERDAEAGGLTLKEALGGILEEEEETVE